MKGRSRIAYFLLLWMCRLFGALPSWFLYSVAWSLVYVVIYYVAGYRRKVVRDNLAGCFTTKDKQWLKATEKKFYKHLAEVVIDSLDIISISPRELKKRIVFINSAQQEERTEGTSWIAALAHYGSWEYFTAYQMFTKSQVVAAYKPLNNKAFDRLYSYSRTRFGMRTVAKKDTFRQVIHNSRLSETFAYGLLADQTPHRGEVPHWFDFLGRHTAFFMGIEKISQKFTMPVYYLKINKLRKRSYTAEFVCLWDGKEQVAEGEITKRYVRILERQILDRPELWMWSHRRWKHEYHE